VKELNAEKLRWIRLEVAVRLATSSNGDAEVKRKLLEAICKADPTIKAVIQTYGIEVKGP
jgi:hypothetical protein